MEQILKALQLAKDSTYAGVMPEPAKEHLRKQLDEAMQQVKNLSLNLPVICWQGFKDKKPIEGQEVIVWNKVTDQKMFVKWNSLYDLVTNENDTWIGSPACR